MLLFLAIISVLEDGPSNDGKVKADVHASEKLGIDRCR
ncbi:hypothetical protein SAMCCGM7_pC1447 (plasmid) [Sinorhizobium americanum CCGM7]|nr:hypothetical protein SAMCCGM7_pC1447 [Sinorhizobium americanum CCGM7]